jgi:hypothetical protein
MSKLPEDTTVIHGAAVGADSIAGHIAHELGLAVEPYPADWDRYGKAAGHIRNRQMLAAKPDRVLAFSKNISVSRGTSHMVKIAQAAGIPTEVFSA